MLSVTYGPLSIDEARAYDEEDDDDNSADDETSPSVPSSNIARHYLPHCRLHCNRRRIFIFISIFFVIISLSLVTMKEMFHLSLPNLLRIILVIVKWYRI